MSLPSTIHGRRQIGMIARRIAPGGCESAQARSAASSQPGLGSRQAIVSIRLSDASASGSVLILVTQTATPAWRSWARVRSPEFSPLVGQHDVGGQLDILVTSGLVPPMRSTRLVRPGRMRAVLRRPGQQRRGAARRDRLGERWDEGDHAGDGAVNGHRVAEVVSNLHGSHHTPMDGLC